MSAAGAFAGTRWLVLLGGAGVRFAERVALQSLLTEHGASVCLRLPSTASRDDCRVLTTPEYVAAYREYEAQEPARRPLCPPPHVRHIDAAVRACVPVVLPAFVRDCALRASKNEPLPDISPYAQFPLQSEKHQTECKLAVVPVELPQEQQTAPEKTETRTRTPQPTCTQELSAATTTSESARTPVVPVDEKQEETPSMSVEELVKGTADHEPDKTEEAAKTDEPEDQEIIEEPDDPEEPEEPQVEEKEEEDSPESYKNYSKAFLRAFKRREAHARKHDAQVVAQRQARLLEKQRRKEAHLLAAAQNPVAAVAQRTAQRRRGSKEYQEHLQWHATRAQHNALCAAAAAAPTDKTQTAKLAQRKVFVGGVSTEDIVSAKLQEVLPTGEIRDRTQCVRQQRINAVKALFSSFGKITQWKPEWDKGYIHVVYSSPKEAALCLRRLGSPEGRAETIAALSTQMHANRLLHNANEAQAALPRHMYVRAAHERVRTAP